MQVVDIIALKPEIELCYMGILTKCFEVLERKYSDSTPGYFESSTSSSSTSEWQHVASNMNHEDSDDTESEDQEDDDTADGDNQADSDVGDESDAESDGSRSEFDEGSRNPRLKLREILFYTEKVEIFKARHGAL